MAEDAAKPDQHAERDPAELTLAPAFGKAVAVEPAEGEHRGDCDQEGYGDSQGGSEGHSSMVARRMLAAGRSVAWLNARALGARELGFESRRPDFAPAARRNPVSPGPGGVR